MKKRNSIKEVNKEEKVIRNYIIHETSQHKCSPKLTPRRAPISFVIVIKVLLSKHCSWVKSSFLPLTEGARDLFDLSKYC